MEKINLKNQEVEVVDCEECGHEMVNIDADQIQQGDLTMLKHFGIRVSNPETEKQICVVCEFEPEEQETFGRKIADFFSDLADSDSDSGFFSGGSFGGSSSLGGFRGFGGGSFGGGGASRGF